MAQAEHAARWNSHQAQLRRSQDGSASNGASEVAIRENLAHNFLIFYCELIGAKVRASPEQTKQTIELPASHGRRAIALLCLGDKVSDLLQRVTQPYHRKQL